MSRYTTEYFTDENNCPRIRLIRPFEEDVLQILGIEIFSPDGKTIKIVNEDNNSGTVDIKTMINHFGIDVENLKD